MDLETAKRCAILWTPTGSQLYGLALNNGASDRDEMGVVIEPIDEAMVLTNPFEHFEYRDSTVRTGKQDEPSLPGELDLKLYSLRKYLKMATSGNPSILELLFAPQGQWVRGHALGGQLQDLAPYIVARSAGRAYLGYIEGQKRKLLGKSNQGRGALRQDLIDKYGYDTKFTMHMLRLGMQGVELLTTGRISLPVLPADREYLLGVRQGAYTLDQCLERNLAQEELLKGLIKTSPLQEVPDIGRIEEWMRYVYFYQWSARRPVVPRLPAPEGFEYLEPAWDPDKSALYGVREGLGEEP